MNLLVLFILTKYWSYAFLMQNADTHRIKQQIQPLTAVRSFIPSVSAHGRCMAFSRLALLASVLVFTVLIVRLLLYATSLLERNTTRYSPHHPQRTERPLSLHTAIKSSHSTCRFLLPRDAYAWRALSVLLSCADAVSKQRNIPNLVDFTICLH